MTTSIIINYYNYINQTEIMPMNFGWSGTFTLVTHKYEMIGMSFHFSPTQNTSKKHPKKKKNNLTTTVWGTLSILHTYQLRIKEKSRPIKKKKKFIKC